MEQTAYYEDKMELDLSAEPITKKDVLEFIQDVYNFRPEGVLPFNTLDYYHMERLIEYLRGSND